MVAGASNGSECLKSHYDVDEGGMLDELTWSGNVCFIFCISFIKELCVGSFLLGSLFRFVSVSSIELLSSEEERDKS